MPLSSTRLFSWHGNRVEGMSNVCLYNSLSHASDMSPVQRNLQLTNRSLKAVDNLLHCAKELIVKFEIVLCITFVASFRISFDSETAKYCTDRPQVACPLLRCVCRFPPSSRPRRGEASHLRKAVTQDDLSIVSRYER